MESNSLSKPDIFNYKDPHEYLRDIYQYKKSVNPSFSARAWAKKMGFSNHSLLSLLLNAKRPIRIQHMDHLMRGLDLDKTETGYFESLVGSLSADTERERLIYDERLQAHAAQSPVTLLDLEKFKFISNWIHTVILEMTRLQDFTPDAQWIAGRIGRNIGVKEVEGAIQRLFALGLLENRSGKWVKTKNRLTTDSARTSRAVREYHKQVIALAHSAVEDQSREERILNSFSFSIDPQYLPEAEILIQEFRAKLAALLSRRAGKETYQCNIQLFRMTKPRAN